ARRAAVVARGLREAPEVDGPRHHGQGDRGDGRGDPRALARALRGPAGRRGDPRGEGLLVSVVSVNRLTKRYGARPPALTEVALEIGEGVTGLLGPNGAGKSTLIQSVLGLLRDFEGDATVLGLDARRDRLAIRRRVGYMPESDSLLPRMSAVRS